MPVHVCVTSVWNVSLCTLLNSLFAVCTKLSVCCRFNDVNVDIRKLCVKEAPELLTNHTDVAKDIVGMSTEVYICHCVT